MKKRLRSTNRILPMKIHRDLLIRLIREANSTDGLLIDWKGTPKEAIAALERGPEYLEGGSTVEIPER